MVFQRFFSEPALGFERGPSEITEGFEGRQRHDGQARQAPGPLQSRVGPLDPLVESPCEIPLKDKKAPVFGVCQG